MKRVMNLHLAEARQHLDHLLGEAYFQEAGLLVQTLGELEQHLEAGFPNEYLNTSPSPEELLVSFERVKEWLALLTQELDAIGISNPWVETPEQLDDRLKALETKEDEPSLVDWSAVTPVVPPLPTAEFQAAEPETLPGIEVPSEGPIEVSAEIPSEDVIEVPLPITASSPALPEESSAPKEIKSVHADLPSPFSNEEDLWVSHENDPMVFETDEGQQYYQLRTFLEQAKLPANLAYLTEPRERLLSIALCYCLDMECYVKLKTGIEAFWPEKESAFSPLLSADASRVDLHPELKRFIMEFVAQHEEWTINNKFPFPSVANSIQYIFSLSEIADFQPNLIDYGILMFFFGKSMQRDTIQFTNVLGIQGLSEPEVDECAMRIFRVYKIRNRILNPRKPFDQETALVLKSDVHRVMQLIRRIHYPEGVTSGAMVA